MCNKTNILAKKKEDTSLMTLYEAVSVISSFSLPDSEDDNSVFL